jgi:hypothetical protein
MVFLILFVLQVASMMSACPSRCTCKNTVVRCVNLDLVTVPDDIPLNTTKLDLSKNSITRLRANSSLAELKQLWWLDLSTNKITDIEYGAVGPIRYLNLDTNELNDSSIERIPTDNLNLLNLRSNFLHRIPSLCNASHLEGLDLSGNKLTSFHFAPCFRQITSLKAISLKNNNNLHPPIMTSDDMLNLNCAVIVEFNCENCGLLSIEKGVLQRFSRLKILHLAYNKFDCNALYSIVSDLALCTYLSDLDISGNVKHYDLPGNFFRPLSKVPLRTLYLRKFMPRTGILKDSFQGLTNLISLLMEMSHIPRIEEDAFAGLDKIQFLTLTNSYGMDLPPNAFPPSLIQLNMTHNFSSCP